MNNFHYAYILANQMFGLTITDLDFEEIAVVGWGLIGNKRTRIYRAVLNVDCKNHSVTLPCNVDIIDALTTCSEDYQHTTNHTEFDNYNSKYIENYIESRKVNKDPLYASGRFVKYHRVDNTLFIEPGLKRVKLLYRGIELDEEGLPSLTDKEALALATYAAYITNYKNGILTKDSATLQIAGVLKQDWEKRCDAARVDSDIWSQNDMNEILDAKTNWNRKQFNISYKPVR
ncbi:MAG: hypothetical protein Nk1A_8680 [Endomicrobiia bacterium]|nr:MAG: hypothetical protein Nk1A_8680 [Endomicrobiia bacterium]